MSDTTTNNNNFVINTGPVNGSGVRLVVTSSGETELYRDEINTDSDAARTQYVDRLLEITDCSECSPTELSRQIVMASDAADELADAVESQSATTTSGRPSQASMLVNLIEELDVELFHDPEGRAYATIDEDGVRKNWSLNSRGFRDWLARQFYLAYQKVPNSQASNDALRVIAGKAKYEGDEHEVHVRFAPSPDDGVYWDLCDPAWRVVHITSGGWSIDSQTSVKFVRSRGMLALPEPQRNGHLSEIRQFVNVSDDQWTLIAGWLIAAVRPDGPYPLLVLNGEQGSCKSTAARVLRQLVDPNKADLRMEPRDNRDLMIMASNSWILSFDNLSYIQPAFSDALCRLATGGGFTARELYSDADEVLFDSMRPVILNGIEELASRADLIDRSVMVTLNQIQDDQRRTEKSFWSDFNLAHARLVGAVCDAVATALRVLPTVSLTEYPRMADFAQWAVAAESSYGTDPGEFLSTYMANRGSANDLALDASQVGQMLVRWVRTRGGQSWRGTATELLAELNNLRRDQTNARGWPRNGQTLSNNIRRVVPNLRRIGIQVEFRHSGTRSIEITTSDSFVNPMSPRPARPRSAVPTTATSTEN